jgi:hypothetical protein
LVIALSLDFFPVSARILSDCRQNEKEFAVKLSRRMLMCAGQQRFTHTPPGERYTPTLAGHFFAAAMRPEDFVAGNTPRSSHHGINDFLRYLFAPFVPLCG